MHLHSPRRSAFSAARSLSRRSLLATTTLTMSSTQGSAMPPQKDVNVALIGSGRYAPTYVEILQLLPMPVSIKYIWSRKEESAKQLQQEAEYTEKSEVASGAEGWEAILKDPSVDAVLIVLPTSVAPEYALQAVEAGKAALSEKPIADSTSDARACMQRYAALPSPAPWLVGENWRFLPVFTDAGAVVGGQLGRVYKMDLVCDIPFTKNTTYFSSQWRRGELSGGFMVDTGVHQIATLRVLADAAGAGAPLRASATSSYDEARGLSDPDTLMGFVEWQSGLRTGVSITLAAAFPRWSLSAAGANGTVEVSRGAWNGKGDRMMHELCYRTDNPEELTCKQYEFNGMERELDTFLRVAASWRGGAEQDPTLAAEVAKGFPEEAFLDLAILEALIEASRKGTSVPVAQPPAA
eukprot:jgi/Ulvmu1/11159/UM071_0043.1